MHFTLFSTCYKTKYTLINSITFSLLRYFFNLVPVGVITIQRFVLAKHLFPLWDRSTTGLCDLHLTNGKKIEDITNVLQV